METSLFLHCDPYLKVDRKAQLPDDLVFACAYDLYVEIVSIQEAAFFRRSEGRDELWIGQSLYAIRGLDKVISGTALPNEIEADYSRGCVFAAPSTDDEATAALYLLSHLIRARVGYFWPSEAVAAGIVTEAAFDSLVASIDKELTEKRERNRQSETEIERVAGELGLRPEPSPSGEGLWTARCPGTNHHLYLETAKEMFTCGWCSRRGGAEELRGFVKGRRERVG